MCSAAATFFYGVFVKSAHLCLASDAYKATKGSLLAVDLICARKRNGLLQSQYQTLNSATRVPEEIWKMIKLAAIDVGLNEAEQRLLRHYFWREDWHEGCNHEIPSLWQADKPECCLEQFWELGGIEDMLIDRSKDIINLASSFGLAVPFLGPDSQEDHPRYDLDARSPISLPLRRRDKAYGSRSFAMAKADTSAEYGPRHETLRFSKTFSELPVDADQRIIRFLSLFRFNALLAKPEIVYAPHAEEPDSESANSSSESASTSDDAGSSVSKNTKADTKPHWYLTAVADQSW